MLLIQLSDAETEFAGKCVYIPHVPPCISVCVDATWVNTILRATQINYTLLHYIYCIGSNQSHTCKD